MSTPQFVAIFIGKMVIRWFRGAIFADEPMFQRILSTRNHGFPTRVWRWSRFPVGFLWLSCQIDTVSECRMTISQADQVTLKSLDLRFEWCLEFFSQGAETIRIIPNNSGYFTVERRSYWVNHVSPIYSWICVCVFFKWCLTWIWDVIH